MSKFTRIALAAGPALGLAVGLAIALPAPAAWSMGSSSDTSSTSAATTANFATAKKLVDEKKYRDAIPILEQLVAKNPMDADALNELGYSHRELGHQEKALTYYLKALSTEPNHLGANEYLGELYLEMKNLPKAEERLAVLEKACTSCEQYNELKEKIADYKAKQQS
jgi:tetratricopeptide (TPR) repeat protein